MKRILLSLLILAILPFAARGDEGGNRQGKGGKGEITSPPRAAVFSETNTEMEFIFIKGGCYRMGNTFEGMEGKSPPYRPLYPEDFVPATYDERVHEVCVSDFHMGRYEVTNRQYRQFVLETGSHLPEWEEHESTYNIYTGGNQHYSLMGAALTADDHPVVGVSWYDAAAFADWLSRKSGRSFRLPTEAQWEFAARGGGKEEKWAGTNELSSLRNYAWFADNADGKTRAVGRKLPNSLGLHDMSGNVWEWCQDWYGDDYYGVSHHNDPNGPLSGTTRVLRGGSWISIPETLRTANREWGFPSSRTSAYGFRIAMPCQ